MESVIDSSERKRPRPLFQEAPNKMTHLRLKHMEESLKSRIGCEIQAFCSNFEALFQEESVSKFSQTLQRSPPQTVPDREARAIAHAFPPTVSEVETSQSERSVGDSTAKAHPDSMLSEPSNGCEEEREMEVLVVRLMELALKLNNSLIEKGL